MYVFDTDIVVSAMRSPTGASAALLRRLRQGRLRLGLTVPLAMEYEAVCLRQVHLNASGLPAEDALQFVDAVIAMAEPISVHFRWRPQLHDPANEMVLEAAVNARAHALVSFNRRHFLPAADRFRLPVVLPGELLRSFENE